MLQASACRGPRKRAMIILTNGHSDSLERTKSFLIGKVLCSRAVPAHCLSVQPRWTTKEEMTATGGKSPSSGLVGFDFEMVDVFLVTRPWDGSVECRLGDDLSHYVENLLRQLCK